MLGSSPRQICWTVSSTPTLPSSRSETCRSSTLEPLHLNCATSNFNVREPRESPSSDETVLESQHWSKFSSAISSPLPNPKSSNTKTPSSRTCLSKLSNFSDNTATRLHTSTSNGDFHLVRIERLLSVLD